MIPYIIDHLGTECKTPARLQNKTLDDDSTPQLIHHISEGINKKQPPHRTVTIALDITKVFDTVNHYTQAAKLLNTNIPSLIIKFIFNYIRGHKHTPNYAIANHSPNSSKQESHKEECCPTKGTPSTPRLTTPTESNRPRPPTTQTNRTDNYPQDYWKKTIFSNKDYTINKETEARLTDNDVRQNLKTIHSIIVQTHLNNRPPN